MNDLTAKQCKAVILLAQGHTGREVSKALSVTPQTLCGWKKIPLFVASINNMKMEVLESTRAMLQNTSNVAVSTLTDIVKNSENDETRRKAALDILRLTGFEPGQHETFAWGIGPRSKKGVEDEANSALSLHKLLQMDS